MHLECITQHFLTWLSNGEKRSLAMGKSDTCFATTLCSVPPLLRWAIKPSTFQMVTCTRLGTSIPTVARNRSSLENITMSMLGKGTSMTAREPQRSTLSKTRGYVQKFHIPFAPVCGDREASAVPQVIKADRRANALMSSRHEASAFRDCQRGDRLGRALQKRLRFLLTVDRVMLVKAK